MSPFPAIKAHGVSHMLHMSKIMVEIKTFV